ncbi:glycoside hydrolase family 55 protein, partial [Bacillus inaquosorum]|nr:glycoside hydrolase family 55 protein [Bacillus inaquosorum]
MTLYLNKRHGDAPNTKLFNQLDENAKATEHEVNLLEDKLKYHEKSQTAHTSDQIDHGGFSLRTYIESLYNRMRNLILNADGTNVKEVVDARVDADGNIAPLLKERLDRDYMRLNKRIKRVVHVDDYGAVADGVTDSSDAIVKAMGNGKVKIKLGPG